MGATWWPGTGDTKLALFENLERNEDLYRNNEAMGGCGRRIITDTLAPPLELIAYVVENDKPYTEILTADYTMVTPLTADTFECSARGPMGTNSCLRRRIHRVP